MKKQKKNGHGVEESVKSGGGVKVGHVLVLGLMLLLLIMPTGCEDKEHYSYVGVKVRDARESRGWVILDVTVLKVSGHYRNEALNESHRLDDGDRIELRYPPNTGFPKVREGDYLRVDITRNGDDYYLVEYMEISSHPYYGYFTTFALAFVCLGGIVYCGFRSFTRKKASRAVSLSKLLFGKCIPSLKERLNRATLVGFLLWMLLVTLLWYNIFPLFLLVDSFTDFIHAAPGLYTLIYGLMATLVTVSLFHLFRLLHRMVRMESTYSGRKSTECHRSIGEMNFGILLVIHAVFSFLIWIFILAPFGDLLDFNLGANAYPHRELDFSEHISEYGPYLSSVLTAGLFFILHGEYRYNKIGASEKVFSEEKREEKMEEMRERGREKRTDSH